MKLHLLLFKKGLSCCRIGENNTQSMAEYSGGLAVVGEPSNYAS
jgi:hypothetical protein